jgi:hypothetical protein
VCVGGIIECGGVRVREASSNVEVCVCGRHHRVWRCACAGGIIKCGGVCVWEASSSVKVCVCVCGRHNRV